MANKFLKALAFTGAAIFGMAQQTHAQNEVTESQMRINCQNGKPTTLFVSSNKTSLVGYPLADGRAIEAWDGFGFNFSDRTIQRGTFVYAAAGKDLTVPVGVADPWGGIKTFKSMDLQSDALSAFTDFVVEAGNACKGQGNGEIRSDLTNAQKKEASIVVSQPLRKSP